MSQYAKASAFGGAGGFSDPMTTRGDLIHRDATNTTARLGVGSADQVLGSDGTDPAWVTLSHTVLSNIGTNTHAQIDTHIASTSNPHSVTKAQVGLGSADNTSDADKPISTATQTALDAKLDDFTSTTDNALVRTNGIAGEAVQDSGIIIDDSDNMSGVGTISSGSITIGGDVVLNRDSANVLRTPDSLIVDGDLTVSGTTTTLDTTNLQVEDANILINKGAATAPADDVAGLSVERGSSGADGSLVWNETNNRFKQGIVGSEVEIVDLSATQTLTNKTLTSPSITTPTGIVKGDVGLGNVDNTSDATKNAATATLTNKTMTRIANSFTRTITTYSTAQTLSVTVDDIVKVSGNTTLTLPAAASSSGVEFTIKKTDSNATTVTLDGNASETIDGATTFDITEQYASYTVVCDGTSWLIL
jgi:hypothetical protein